MKAKSEHDLDALASLLSQRVFIFPVVTGAAAVRRSLEPFFHERGSPAVEEEGEEEEEEAGTSRFHRGARAKSHDSRWFMPSTRKLMFGGRANRTPPPWKTGSRAPAVAAVY